MKTHTMFGVGFTALILGGFATASMTLAGGKTVDAAQLASDNAGKASKALSKGDAAQAIALVEAAVAISPQNADYRMLLGQSYLKAGRFTSANQAFTDVLALEPANGKAALNLALTQIADGHWDVARQTLADHAGGIPARDRGLAQALAGDPQGGLEILIMAARSPEADAKTRQNLALTLALAGRWREAKTMVEADVSPEEANKRILQWIAFAKPVTASDQVAALLHVVAVKDAGQPVALALNAPVAMAEVASVEPVEAAAVAPAEMPVETAMVADVPVVVAPVDAAPVVETAAVEPVAQKVVFAERQEVVQILPPRAERRPAVKTIAAKGAFKTKVAVAAAPAAKGNWYVQLGAFENAAVARDAWARAKRRYAAFGGQTPAGMNFKSSGGEFYRLSVGGFARPDAVAMCKAFKARGGNCFVRAGAGDQVAQWVKPARVQVASR